jgi:glycosidase
MMEISTNEDTMVKESDSLPTYSPEQVENAVIYEANIRQYSQEGTFQAFTNDIPELERMGVKILWVMPIQPISLKRRKATHDKSIEDIDDPEAKKKYRGSYYAIADYKALNPNFGSLEDFKTLVDTAHKHGIYVILDWVANHTGWDHPWIKEHPEYYQKDEEGKITDPLNGSTGEKEGWDDVAQLNYDNGDLFETMKDEMLYWLKETSIDGFRCDVADRVKLEFWEYAYGEFNKEEPVFMLMESDNPDYLKSVFDMGYNWKMHHIMNEIAQGRNTVHDFDNMMEYLTDTYQREDILMNFISNHDENSWNGSEFERLGNAVEAFTALIYAMPGMPLIYNGQEYDSKKRLKFFVKDSFTREKGKMFPVFEKLGKLKNENAALNGGVNKASYERLSTSDDEHILAFKREKEGEKVYYIANLSNTYKKISLSLEGEFKNYMEDETVTLKQDEEIWASPWQYWILVQ